jgi:superfamily I DNA and RNA helicase
LTPKEFNKLNDLLYPEVIQLPPRAGIGKHQLHRQIQALDEAQAQLARRLGRGHQIIKGPPGSGKTLVLVHRCFQLRNYHHQIRRILVVCYNIAFASYLKRLLLEKGVGLGEEGVEIFHFFELCAAMMGERVDFDSRDSEYYQLVVEETLGVLGEGKSRLEPFDAILVDEGQDLNNDMLRVILRLLKPKGDLVIALDAYQDLYRRDFSWRSVGIEAQGRTHYLGKIYRNTFEILTFSQRFIGAAPVANRQPSLPLYDEFHGEPPQLLHFGDFNQIEAFLSADIQNQITGGEYKRSEIGIIYDDKMYSPESFTYDSRDLPHRIKRCLEKAGIPVKWVSEDVRSKEMFDITTDSVSLLSIHSSKGLDFDLVYLIGADHITPSEETRDYLSGLLYVAVTRAKHRLVIPYVQETEFIARMRACLQK